MRTLLFSLLLMTLPVWANPLLETRYCGEPKRDAQGQIMRSTAVAAAFQKAHPCPSTNKKTGACRGWAKDHVIPLACGGCDAVSNTQWIPQKIKSGWQDWNKDRFERLIYEAEYAIANTKRCNNQIVIITD